MGSQETPSVGQVEREVSQRVQALYRESLGHQPTKVTCQLFGTSVAIVIENSVTPPEKLLATEGQEELVRQFREDLDDVMKPQVKQLIEKILSVEVVDVMSDATLETGRTGIIAVLSEIPPVRNPLAIPKAKRHM